jgi:hypothetical protein
MRIGPLDLAEAAHLLGIISEAAHACCRWRQCNAKLSDTCNSAAVHHRRPMHHEMATAGGRRTQAWSAVIGGSTTEEGQWVGRSVPLCRSATELFRIIKQERSDRKYTVAVTLFEIYNEVRSTPPLSH